MYAYFIKLEQFVQSIAAMFIEYKMQIFKTGRKKAKMEHQHIKQTNSVHTVLLCWFECREETSSQTCRTRSTSGDSLRPLPILSPNP